MEDLSMNKSTGHLRLDTCLGQGMVIQRDRDFLIQGSDLVGTKIRLVFDGLVVESHVLPCQSKGQGEGQVDKGRGLGDFELTLPPHPAGGPYELILEGSESLHFQEVYVGDLFLMAGQSNMELPLARLLDVYEELLKQDMAKPRDHGPIYQLTLEKRYAFSAGQKMKGQWEGVSPSTLPTISGVGYFFAKAYQELVGPIPVGLVQAAVGGSPLAAWCHEAVLQEHLPEAYQAFIELQDVTLIKNRIQADREAAEAWFMTLGQKDPGLVKAPEKDPIEGSIEDVNKSLLDHAFFMDETGEDSRNDWQEIMLPADYQSVSHIRNHTGSLWLMREFTLTTEEVDLILSGELRLRLGTLVDRDEVYVNDVLVGATAYQYPPRNYLLPGSILKEGKNLIKVRQIIDHGQGAVTKGKPLCLVLKNGKGPWRRSLRGSWLSRIGAQMEEAPQETFFLWKPAALYYGMLESLKWTKFKGVLWYQGESDIETEAIGHYYAKLFEAVVGGMRDLLGEEDLPLVGCLLAGLGQGYGEPPYSNLGKIGMFRLEQLKALEIKRVGMVSAMDLGEYNDIHPLRKEPIGRRMAKVMHGLVTDGQHDPEHPQGSLVRESDGWYLLFTHRVKAHKESKVVVSLTKPDYTRLLPIKRTGPCRFKIMGLPIDHTVNWVAYGVEDYPTASFLYDEAGRPLYPFKCKAQY